MMDYVIFEREDGTQLKPLDYGILLKTFDAPPPSPKLYTEAIDGMDGDLDMTEWAGEIRYNNRKVTVNFRDMSGEQYARLINFLHGRKVIIYHSTDLSHYFEGRCVEADDETRRHVTDFGFEFSCYPYRRAATLTRISKTLTGSTDIILTAARESVAPTFTVSAQTTVTYNNTLYSLRPGTAVIPNLIINDTPQTITVNTIGTVTIQWRDGVL